MPKRPESVKSYSYEDLRVKAEAFLEEHHSVRSIPVPIEAIIELRFELDIVPIPNLLHGSDVYALISSSTAPHSRRQMDRKLLTSRGLGSNRGQFDLASAVWTKMGQNSLEELRKLTCEVANPTQ